MRFRLIVTDLDGTLVGRGLHLSSRTERAVQALAARGCPLTFATGRAWPGTLTLARQLDLALPVIAFQGALARHHDGRPPLWHDPLSLSLIHI